MAKRTAKKKDIKSSLAELAEAWGDAEETSFEDVPDGVYQVRINQATINHSQSSGRLQVSWDVSIVNGEFVNRKLFDHHGIDNAQSIGYFKGTLSKLGYDSEEFDPTSLDETLEELVGTYAEVRQRTKGDYTNVYFNKALDSNEVEDDTEDSDGGGGDGDTAEETTDWAVGDKVVVDFDGEDFTGEINDIDGDEATVSFDDGEEEVVGVEDLKEPDNGDEDEEEDEDEDEEEDEDEDEEEGGVSVDFDDGSVSAKAKKDIKALAEEWEFSPDDYDDLTTLLADIAEEAGVEGSFKTAPTLIKAIKAAE